MSRQAKAYIILTATLGVLILGHAPAAIRPGGDLRFLAYLVGAALTSQLKVRLPGINGTLSVHFFFIMMGVLDLDTLSLLAARLKHMIPFDTVAIYVRQHDRLSPTKRPSTTPVRSSPQSVPRGRGR